MLLLSIFIPHIQLPSVWHPSLLLMTSAECLHILAYESHLLSVRRTICRFGQLLLTLILIRDLRKENITSRWTQKQTFLLPSQGESVLCMYKPSRMLQEGPMFQGKLVMSTYDPSQGWEPISKWKSPRKDDLQETFQNSNLELRLGQWQFLQENKQKKTITVYCRIHKLRGINKRKRNQQTEKMKTRTLTRKTTDSWSKKKSKINNQILLLDNTN